MTSTIDQHPAELLQHLIRFDTTNPPGNEIACITYLDKLLTEAGFATTIVARSPNRPNLVTRLAGRGTAPPLLLYGHVDVVTTKGQSWQHPPFEGKIVNGYVWGRGALDMKGGVAMMVAATLRAKSESMVPTGDIVLAVLSDEEAGGDNGARYLVEEHASLFEGIRYAIGEFGGFSLQVGPRVFYPIMVSEKQICWMRLTVRGPGGHGSLPLRGGAMAKLGHLLQRLDQRRLPIHITPVTRQMIEAMASALPFPMSAALRQLLNPRMTDRVLARLGSKRAIFEPLLRNTVNPTIVHGGDKVNVIPSVVTVELDGRLLPGYRPHDMIAELRQIVGDEAELAVDRHDPGPAAPDMGLFHVLAEILRDKDPLAIAVPLMLPGITDSRWFSQLGIQTYGFLPMRLPDTLSFWSLAHAADERIPAEALSFGTDAIYKLLQRFGTGK